MSRRQPMQPGEESPIQCAHTPLEYHYVQAGYPLVVGLAMTSVATLVSTWIFETSLLATELLWAQLAAAVSFCSLEIQIKDGWLRWRFGAGWIRGSVPLSEVVATYIVVSPFAYGWGFYRARSRWKWRRGGTLALEIQCRSGKRLRLATPHAHELQLLLERSRKRPHTNSNADTTSNVFFPQ